MRRWGYVSILGPDGGDASPALGWHGGSRRPAGALNQPDNECDQKPEDDKRSEEDRNNPSTPADRGQITLNCGLRIATNLASQYGHVSSYLHSRAKPNIRAEHSDVTGNFCLIFNYHAAEKGGYIAGHLSAHANVATEARQFGGFLVLADADVVTPRRVVGFVGGERGGGQSKAEENAGGKRRVRVGTVRHKHTS
jgi:hypothetical protein